jgi:hypothetical protein
MTIESCDNCRRQIKDYSGMRLRLGLTGFDICQSCATPVIKVLGKRHLLSSRIVKKLQLELIKNLEKSLTL